MTIKSSTFSKALIMDQISSYSMVRYLSAFMVSQIMNGPTILSKVIPHHTEKIQNWSKDNKRIVAVVMFQKPTNGEILLRHPRGYF